MAGSRWVFAACFVAAGIAGIAFGTGFKLVGVLLVFVFFLMLFGWSLCEVAGICSRLEDSRSEIADDQNAWR